MDITRFLEECKVELFKLNMDHYPKSLEDIVKCEQENRSQRAQIFLIDIEKQVNFLFEINAGENNGVILAANIDISGLR